MLKKILMLSAATVAMMALFAAPASAQYDEVFNASIDDTTVTPGQTVTIAGECNVADEIAVDLIGHGELGTIPVVDDAFSAPVSIPSDLAPGTYTLTASCGDAEVLSIDITVVAAGGGGSTGGSGTSAPPLARTGSPTETLVKVGGGLLLAGAAATLFATKRRSVTA